MSEPLSLLSNQILGLLLPPSDENFIIVGTLFAQLFFPLRQIYSVQNSKWAPFLFHKFPRRKTRFIQMCPCGASIQRFPNLWMELKRNHIAFPGGWMKRASGTEKKWKERTNLIRTSHFWSGISNALAHLNLPKMTDAMSFSFTATSVMFAMKRQFCTQSILLQS